MARIHPLSDVQSVNIGENTAVWQFAVILPGARIGNDCNICSHVFIENDVIVGDAVTVKAGVQLWDGIRVEDRVFIGPNVTFTNDLFPRSKQPDWVLVPTWVKTGASIGANATIIAGNTIGAYAMVGAGSVVTKSIPDYHLYVGNPAKHTGFVTEDGTIVSLGLMDKSGNRYRFENGKISVV